MVRPISHTNFEKYLNAFNLGESEVPSHQGKALLAYVFLLCLLLIGFNPADDVYGIVDKQQSGIGLAVGFYGLPPCNQDACVAA